MSLASVCCPACGAVLAAVDDVAYPRTTIDAGGPTRVLLCPECGHGVADPMLTDDDLAELYANSSYWGDEGHKSVNETLLPVPFALARARWRILSSEMEGTPGSLTILDIGAGHGCLGLVAAGASGSPVACYTAVEPDEEPRTGLRDAWQRAGFDADLKQFVDLGDVRGQFDVAVLSHVIEHVPDPKALLERVVPLVKSGGLVFVDVPNQDYLFKGDVFPHVQFFNPTSLERLLCRIGLADVLVGAWGRSWKASPLNANVAGLRYCSRQVVGVLKSRLAHFVPGDVLVGFNGWYFGANRRDAAGTWVRGTARRP